MRSPNRCRNGATQPAMCSEPCLSAMASTVSEAAGKESFCGLSNWSRSSRQGGALVMEAGHSPALPGKPTSSATPRISHRGAAERNRTHGATRRDKAPTAAVRTGNLPYRGLAMRRRRQSPTTCRLPVRDTAGCRSALRTGVRCLVMSPSPVRGPSRGCNCGLSIGWVCRANGGPAPATGSPATPARPPDAAARFQPAAESATRR
jgi:hypothetical protein